MNDKRLLIHFVNPERSSRFALRFRLENHRFAEKWLVSLKKVIKAKVAIKKGGVFYGSRFHDRDDLLGRMQKQLDIVNRDTPGEILLRPHAQIDQAFLDELHKEFERLSTFPIYRPSGRSSEGRQALIELNDAIHQYEGILGVPCWYFGMDVNFQIDYKLDLLPEDFEYFTPHNVMGGLYLNYATVGVPVLIAFEHRESKPPVPQQQYRPDFSVSFNPDREFDRWDELKNWLSGNFDWDVNDRKLALGQILLGQVEDHGLSDQDLLLTVKAHRIVERVEILENT